MNRVFLSNVVTKQINLCYHINMKDTYISNSPDKTEVFWQLVEEQHGAVRAFCLSQYYANELVRGEDKKKNMYWGLSYITDKGFFFYHFPQQSMIESLMGKSVASDFCIGLIFENIQSWKYLAPEKSFWKRLLVKKEVGLMLTGISMRYSLDHKGIDKDHNDTLTSILCRHTFLLDLKTKQMVETLRSIIGDKEEREGE